VSDGVENGVHERRFAGPSGADNQDVLSFPNRRSKNIYVTHSVHGFREVDPAPVAVQWI
jgi:hypothetical protein